MEGRAECWGGWGLLRISQKNRILGWDVVAWAKNNTTVRLLKKQRKKKGETLSQRERYAQPSLWPIGTVPPPHPQKKQGRSKKKKPHFLSKPADKGFRERPVSLSPLHLPWKLIQAPSHLSLLGALCWFRLLCSVLLRYLSFI